VRKRPILAFLLASMLIAPLYAQGISIQGSNEMRWADGQETLGGQQQTKRYFENRLNTDFYYNRIRIGTRITMLQPSEFGETRFGPETLEKRFLEFSDPQNNYRMRVGDFTTTWGRGLTLALLEDVNQGFDSGLDGMLVAGESGPFEVEVLAGRSHGGWLGLVREAQISGGHLGVTLPAGFAAGGQALLVTPVPDVNSYRENRSYGGYLSFDGSAVSLWAEHAIEEVDGSGSDHDASYGSLSWYGGRVGIALDYKRYRYYRFTSGLSGAGSTYAQSVGTLPFHNAPVVQREFTSNLFSKHPHIVRFDDEVGVQLEVTYNPTNASTLVLSYSQSSQFVEREGWVPLLDEEESPFRELFLELTAYPAASWYMSAWTGYNEEVVFTNRRISWTRQVVAGAGSDIVLTPDWSLKSSAEGVRVEDVAVGDDYFDGLVVAGVTWRSRYTAAVTYEWTGQQNPPNDASQWVKVDMGAFIANRHELLVTIGQERGGLVCSSGKCRVVTPFDGVKVSLTTLF